MKELERFVKISFDEGGKNNTKYFWEESHTETELEIIPLLVQGYVRCLNTCKSSFFSHDKKESETLHYIIRRILLVAWKNIDLIQENYEKFGYKFDIIEFIKMLDKKWEIEEVLSILDAFQRTDNIKEISSNVYVKYEVKVGERGTVIMYHPSRRINSFIQITSYIILLKTLLPRLNNFNVLMFFIKYMVEVDKAIEVIDYTSIKGMARIIKIATYSMKEIVEGLLKECKNDQSYQYFKYLSLSLTRWK